MTLTDRLRQMREATAPRQRISAADMLRRCRTHGQREETGGPARVERPSKQPDPREDPAFVRWMHETQPCLVAGFGGCSGRLEFHHVRRFGEKRDDRRGIMACSGHHREGKHAIHKIGKAAFEKAFGISLEAEIRRCREGFAS